MQHLLVLVMEYFNIVGTFAEVKDLITQPSADVMYCIIVNGSKL